MSRLRCLAAAVLPLVLLAGCTADSGTPVPATSATDEAIVGGLETVAPGADEEGDSLEDGTLSAGELAAVVDGAGDGYQCESTASGYTCSAGGDAAGITIVGTADDLSSVQATGAVPGETFAALAEALGVDAGDLGDPATGVDWQQQ